jgi:serine/threonine-protein kinase HipA
MSHLNVELYGVQLGRLVPEHRSFAFEVNPSVFEHYPLSTTIMSLSVPLSMKLTAAQKRRSIIFFEELLPEGRNLTWLLQTLPIDERNTYGFLKKYGMDSAGALLIYDPDEVLSTKKPRIEKVDSEQIRHLLDNMPQTPLANSPISGKTSLGGVQGKIVLARKRDSWYRVHDGAASTHILKPVTLEYPTMVYDEAFCMQLAAAVGLTSHPVWIESFAGADALVIERYDRKQSADVVRIHQEDFNQALGARGDQKYQEVGGRVSAKRIAETLERAGDNGDVSAFAAQLLFAVAIGNLDMHAKNVSVLHFSDGTMKLAPTYDQVPLRHQPTDGRMALAIGNEYIHANLTREHLIRELLSWHNSALPNEAAVSSFVTEKLEVYRDALSQVALHAQAYPKLSEDIDLILTRLLSGKAIGSL